MRQNLKQDGMALQPEGGPEQHRNPYLNNNQPVEILHSGSGAAVVRFAFHPQREKIPARSISHTGDVSSIAG